MSSGCNLSPPLTCRVCSHFFTFILMMTGAFSQMLFSELKVTTDNLHLSPTCWEDAFFLQDRNVSLKWQININKCRHHARSLAHNCRHFLINYCLNNNACSQKLYTFIKRALIELYSRLHYCDCSVTSLGIIHTYCACVSSVSIFHNLDY